MRIAARHLVQRRLKLIEARKAGATYFELRKRFGVSPNYLSKLFKGKDINKYCRDCGKNDPFVLNKHHPDRDNKPDYTIWLCSNCHSKAHRDKKSERAKRERAEKQRILAQPPIQQKENDGNFSMDKSIPQADPVPQHRELNETQKAVVWAVLAAAAIHIFGRDKAGDPYQKEHKETKVDSEPQSGKTVTNGQSSLVGRTGFVTSFVGRTLISRTPAVILEEYPETFKVELADARKVHVPRNSFIFV